MSAVAKIAIGFHLVVAIITFGHSASNAESLADCEARLDEYTFSSCISYTSQVAVVGRGIIAGALWPLYWAWELQQ